MLTQDFISKVQAGSTPGAAPSSPTQDLTDDTAYNAWKSGAPVPTAAPASSFHPVNDIVDQAKSGLNQMQEGADDAAHASNPLEETEAGMKELAGGVATVTAPLAPVVKPIGDIATWLGQKLGNTSQMQDFVKNHPAAASALHRIATDAGNTSTVLGTAMGGEGAIEGAPKVAGAVEDTVNSAKGINAVHDGISNLIESENPTETLQPAPAKFGKPTPSGLSDQIKTSLAKNNIDPRLEASARRLADPSTTYDDYAAKAKAAVSDVKADPPLATVGEHIGTAYDNVVKTRRAVGEKMATELEKVKDAPVDLESSFDKFESELNKNGLQYDAETKKFAPQGQSKMTGFDQELVANYVEELNKLGSNPTAGDMDAFLSRVPKELDVAKAGKNITDTTNAERLIKGNLADLRTSLTKQPGMQGYAKARAAYSNLSNFLDEGSHYLGAKTQSGDYARDTSIAKSSAESILSGGKKDWLVRLEGLTGYPALDDATLAIQAMKDAGDARGLSLFKVLTDGSIPTPHGVLSKLVGWGAEKAASAVVGSPTEQTQAFLKSLRDGKSFGTAQITPITKTAGIKPSASQKAPKARTSKSDIN